MQAMIRLVALQNLVFHWQNLEQDFSLVTHSIIDSIEDYQ
jgi:hypothetical protein